VWGGRYEIKENEEKGKWELARLLKNLFFGERENKKNRKHAKNRTIEL
jgi:hypothetical protein